MFGWRERIAGWKAGGPDEEPEAPRTVDEFAAAEKLDNDAEADVVGSTLMRNALEDLRSRHLAFRRAEKCEECDLDELRLDILKAVTESDNLRDYYREAWGLKETERADASFSDAEPWPWRRIAVMQVDLMARAFSTLQLQRFANARENRGWMTLFRAWGRSPRFNRVFDEIRDTLPPAFVAFYRLYLYDLPSFTAGDGRLPVHHPWLVPSVAIAPGPRGRGLYMDSGIVEGDIEVDVRPGSGGVTDPRGPERADQNFEFGPDTPTGGGTEPAPNE